MSDDQFTKLFKYMQEFRAAVDKQFEQNRKEHGEINAAIAELSAQVRDYHQEVLTMSRQMDRLRDAIKQIAAETGVKLQVEL
jgi:uncharacterized coiled-coil DUF342 family protein